MSSVKYFEELTNYLSLMVMKTALHLSFLILILLLKGSHSYGQNYNAGVGSGAGGTNSTHVGTLALKLLSLKCMPPPDKK